MICKKLLPASAICALCAPALAQTGDSVTLYGILDVGFTYVDNQAGESDFFLGEGINFGNRFGLRGTEDLGNGYAAIFTLENGFSLGNGAARQSGRLFGRQAFAGLRTPYGTLTMGRQYDFVREYIQQFNIGGIASVYAGHQGDFDRISGKQMDSSVKYMSPSFGGFSFGGMYAFGPDASSSRGNAWSVGAGYRGSALRVGATYTRLNDLAIYPYATSGIFSFLGNEVARIDPATGEVDDLYDVTTPGYALDKQSIAGIGASYQFANKLTLAGNVTVVRFDDGERSASQRVAEVGVNVPLGGALSGIVAWQYAKLEDTHWNQPTLGLRYDLSKRTWLYASASYLKASNGTHASQGAGFYLTPADRDRQSTLRVAMVHTF
ncbi:porin [Verticiella sediminum]|uniref:Porin n=1 Tax=Verticiella sediminum TaxID=1247510 RepID=A0A556AVZ6_9BURK|nr:porin [Verticiella sediminum]TSH97097.1 porin [Verticiella sediminum]